MSKKPGKMHGPFVQLRMELMTSPAWRERSVPLMRILDRLMVEHMRHAGQRNGRLYVSYGQFEQAGVSRKMVKSALQLGEDLGLLQVIVPSGLPKSNIREPNAYRLTYLSTGAAGPTDEWRTVDEKRAENAVNKCRGRFKSKPHQAS